ncbi:MAG: hypothetical protein EOO78_28970, partial [Oxalobacteraceae bacterium]
MRGAAVRRPRPRLGAHPRLRRASQRACFAACRRCTSGREAAMRILHLVSYSLFSGPVPPTLGLAVAQRAAGHQVYLAADTQRGNFNGYEEAAAPHLAAADFAPPANLHLSTHAGPWQTLCDLRRLQAFVRQAQIDVVHCHTSHDHTLMALLPGSGPTLMRTVHNAHLWRRRFLQRRLLARCAGLIVRSRAHHALFSRQLGVAGERLRAIAAGVDSRRFASPSSPAAGLAWRRRLGVPASAPLVGQVAL